MSGFYDTNDEIIQNVSEKKNANSKRLKQFDVDLKTKRLHISTRQRLCTSPTPTLDLGLRHEPATRHLKVRHRKTNVLNASSIEYLGNLRRYWRYFRRKYYTRYIDNFHHPLVSDRLFPVSAGTCPCPSLFSSFECVPNRESLWSLGTRQFLEQDSLPAHTP